MIGPGSCKSLAMMCLSFGGLLTPKLNGSSFSDRGTDGHRLLHAKVAKRWGWDMEICDDLGLTWVQ